MTTDHVAHLRLRCPAGTGGRARQYVEDALRLAPRGGERLLLIRHLGLGRQRLGPTSAPIVETAAERLRAIGRSAVHGTIAGPDSAAVWFVDAAEARQILVLRLLRGESTAGWFWRLAVPDWQDTPAPFYLSQSMARATSGADRLSLARLICWIASQGALPALTRALARSDLPDPVGPWQVAGADTLKPPVGPDLRPELSNPTHDVAVLSEVRQIIAALPAAMREAIVAELLRHDLPPIVRRWVAAAIILANQPASAGMPDTLRALIGALADPITTRTVLLTGSAKQTNPAIDGPQTHEPAVPDHSLRPEEHVAHPEPCEPRDPTDPLGSPFEMEWTERRSAGAGLFLIVNAFEHLDFPVWLNRQTDPAMGGFPASLMAHIAHRQRIQAEDPLFDVLGHAEPRPDWQPLFDLWRVGLDRWLRRTVQRRLADLVHRPGWLQWTDEKISVRYPLDHADLNLRRSALDRDPGWTPWLGRVVVYSFSDEVRR